MPKLIILSVFFHVQILDFCNFHFFLTTQIYILKLFDKQEPSYINYELFKCVSKSDSVHSLRSEGNAGC